MSWYRIETWPCPYCGAQPGDPCTTPSGRKANIPHSARTHTANYCPQCHHPTQQPGYCDRCQLLRQLNTERATKHRRQT